MSSSSARNVGYEASEIKLRILGLKNLNTNFEIPEAKIKFDQLLEDGVALGIPKLFCTQGHDVGVILRPEGSTHNLKMNVTAKVISAEDQDRAMVKVKLKFLQFSKDDWQKLKSSFELKSS